MAKTRFEYVKEFEQSDVLQRNSWFVVRIDGHKFHRFSDVHEFEKPHDLRAVQLMNAAASDVMREFGEIIVAFGESDEFSFVFRRDTRAYKRRREKLVTLCASLFASSFVYNWSRFFPETELQYPPSFDARAVCYPTDRNIRDYLSWRQADTHINCQYNSAFWLLVQKGGLSAREAEQRLCGTVTQDKNEIMFELGLNYNDVPAVFRRGSTLLWTRKQQEQSQKDQETSTEQVLTGPAGEAADTAVRQEKQSMRKKARRQLVVLHDDIIRDDFWRRHDGLIPIPGRRDP
ncbi:MAG: hypothetical protein MHM6MM_006074 [Cercozoa sp. M6MM]